MKENKRGTIWIYAIILFTSAFIILLFTAYSQIKINNDLDNYKSQVSSKEDEKKIAQQSFLSAQEMNKQLNSEIDRLDTENKLLQKNIDDLLTDKRNAKNVIEQKEEALGLLIQSLAAYQKDDVVESAAMIKNIDEASINAEYLYVYKEAALNIYYEAGRQLFNEGFFLYKAGKHDEAVEKFLLSFEYAPLQDYSDKCLYYLADSELRLDRTKEAVEHMLLIIKNFPSSKYLGRAEDFIERHSLP